MVTSALRRAVLAPVWVGQVFTQAKSFRDNPVIGSHLLNRLGLHAGRLLIAHGIMRLRYLLQTPWVSAEDRTAFWRDGFILKHDFLPRDEFEKLREGVLRYDGVVRELIEGKTITQRVLLEEELLAERPEFGLVTGNRDLTRLMRYASATNLPPLYYVENLVADRPTGVEDPQTAFHADTFHPTAKCWLFLNDVTAEQGPFVYVPGSHRLTWGRLKWEHRRGALARDFRDGHSENGSFRVEPHELPAMGYRRSPRSFEVRANSLIVSCTFGFHARGIAAPGTNRLAIWGFSRTNPFNPFPGIDSKPTRRIGELLRRRYFRALDRQTRDGAVPNRRIYTGPLRLLAETGTVGDGR